MATPPHNNNNQANNTSNNNNNNSTANNNNSSYYDTHNVFPASINNNNNQDTILSYDSITQISQAQNTLYAPSIGTAIGELHWNLFLGEMDMKIFFCFLFKCWLTIFWLNLKVFVSYSFKSFHFCFELFWGYKAVKSFEIFSKKSSQNSKSFESQNSF